MRFEPVELGGGEQALDGGGPLPGPLGAHEEPILSTMPSSAKKELCPPSRLCGVAISHPRGYRRRAGHDGGVLTFAEDTRS